MPSQCQMSVKNNRLRGDFYFRDVYKRNTYASFADQEYSDRSTLYITEDDQAIPCTSQVSTFNNGEGSLHIYAKNGANVAYDKGNVAQAVVSTNANTTTFRSSNTHVTGGFTVGATLKVVSRNVGVNTAIPQFTLDVDGDCNLSAGSVYRINGAPVLSSTEVTTVSGQMETLTVSGSATLRDVDITGNLSVSGAFVSSGPASVMYGTETPFIYLGPGNEMTNGVPFQYLMETRASGTAFVTASGSTDNHIFTFSTSGSYMLQAEVEVGYPWMPDGDISTYYIVNANPGSRRGRELHTPSNFSCTRPYMLTVNASDNVRFVIDSSSRNEYEVGLNSTRLTILKLT